MAGEEPRYPSRSRAWWLLAILFLASIVSVIDRGILNIVVDPIKADLGVSDVQIGLLQGLAFGLFYASVGLPLGLTADRRSRRGLIIGGVVVWSLATTAAGFVHSFGGLFAARLLVGLGEAALSPAAISLIGDLFPAQARGRPISVFLMGQALANGIAISITSLIVAAAAAGRFAGVALIGGIAPWRVAFILCGAAGLLVVAGLLTTREPERNGGKADPRIGLQIAAAVRHLGARRRTFLPLYLAFAMCFAAAYATAAWAPAMLMRGFGATTLQIGQWLGPMSMLFSVLGPALGGVLVDRQARLGRPTGGLRVLMVAPLCVIPSALAVLAPNLGIAMFLVALSGAIVAVIGTTMLAMLQALLPPQMCGLGVSLTGLVNTVIGATGGPLLVAAITEHVFHDPARVGFSIAAVVIPSVLAGSALFALAARSINGAAPARSLLQESP